MGLVKAECLIASFLWQTERIVMVKRVKTKQRAKPEYENFYVFQTG